MRSTPSRSAIAAALVTLAAVSALILPIGPAAGQSPPEATPTIYFSAADDGVIDGLEYADEDIFSYDVATGTWAMVFDGSDVLSPDLDIDGFHIGDGTIEFSIRAASATVGPLTMVGDSDTVVFTAASLGPSTAGSLAFGLKSVDLDPGVEDIDAVALTTDGRTLLSTIGVANVTGLDGNNLRVNDEDAIVSDGDGRFSLYFDGSDVALAQEDVVGLSVGAGPGELFLATQTTYQVPGLVAGDGDDVLQFTGTIGAATSGTYSLLFDGDTVGLDIQIDGLQVEFTDPTLAPSVAGRVTDPDGQPVTGVRTNLFTEGRVAFLGASDTASDGGYGYDLPEPGCYVITFIAPGGAVWESSGGTFLNRPFCATAGEAVTGVNAVLVSAASRGTATGTVVDDGDAGVMGVKAVLYRANGSGGRGQWLGPAFTGADGSYRFDVDPGCYVIDLVAPEELLWSTTNTRFKQFSFCVAAGETVAGLGDVLFAPGSGAFLTGAVAAGDVVPPRPVAGVRGVLYEAEADGSRGRWLGPTFTAPDGVFTFEVDPGCYLIDLVAPSGQIWASTSGTFKQLSACAEVGAVTDTGVSTLLPAG